MTPPTPPRALRSSVSRLLLPLLAWIGAWTAMLALDGYVDLANLAMVLVLGAAVATLWLPIWASLALSAASVTAFNWLFVPPRYTFSVDLRQDALLLAAMLVVCWIVAGVMARQRVLADAARQHARRTEQLRSLGQALRDTDDPARRADILATTLSELLGKAPLMLLLKVALPSSDDDDAALIVGSPTAHQRSGLWHCTRRAQPFGPGTGRYAELPEWYLPLRGRARAFGAVAIELDDPVAADDEMRAQAQALCDQMGAVLEQVQTQRVADAARQAAQTQGVRNALLAAISHDYRTPLATILGSASSLLEQGDRLAPEQRQKLARAIVDECGQLKRLTDNTLQLARLDAPGVQLRTDWESAEEIVGAVLRRVRTHDHARRVKARLEPGLPLLRCDALLLTQLLENLVDNALKYSEGAIELLVRGQADGVTFAVRDRGPGVPPAERERIFEVFQRGPPNASDAARRGAGVGLAVCRAIARAHGGELTLRPRGHGGASFECRLPALEAPPPQPGNGQVEEEERS